MNYDLRFIFLGSSRLSVIVLDELGKLGMKPALIVTTPDKPQGRKLLMTPNVVKQWAIDNQIPFLDPAKLDAGFIESFKSKLDGVQLFIVASYGKIIPKAVLDLLPNKTLNIHPSLLPKYRGASPLPTAMLEDAKETGVSIMRLDEQMDHGPIVAQKSVSIAEWPTYEDFEEMMAREGARLLAASIPGWLSGEVQEVEQDHSKATYTKKIAKKDAQLDLTADAYENFRKIQAYHAWPQAYFMAERGGKQIRVKVTRASFADGRLTIERVIPEGAREMAYEDFLHGQRS